MARSGIFYGVGVGPGDPQLLTLRACDVIRAADVIAYITNREGKSRARSIAAELIPGEAAELPVQITMNPDRASAKAAYDRAATDIAGHLEAGRSVAYLCVGDPLLYGSFSYMLARLGSEHAIEVVSGISSFNACAADLRHPLATGNEVLKVVPATLPEERLRAELEAAESFAIVKVGRHFDKIRRVLVSLGLAENTSLIEAAPDADGQVIRLTDLPAGAQPYFSTILMRRGSLPC